MADHPTIFRNLACSDMVRKALQNHAKHQPIANDDRIDSLLSRLAEAEATAKRDENTAGTTE
jgi:ABC-type lipopolysaccharide export system ATPase subunit